MALPHIDINLFLILSRFPNEILDHIINYIPKCMLPELLYFRSIKPFVAYRVLMNVAIKFSVQRQKQNQFIGYVISPETRSQSEKLKRNHMFQLSWVMLYSV
ncbi:hypothetical protein MGQ_02050 [Candida albicans P76067]|nr:hypothetical protein MGQ_02050 [Candida albicans P76067]